MAKKKVHKLDFEFEDDFKLIGIASHENDYRLSWAINKLIGLELNKSEDFIISHPKYKIESNYSMYHYWDDNDEITYQLISNKSEKGFLIPEIKNIDFILKISGDLDDKFIIKLLLDLKKIEIVITAFTIENLPEKMYKIFSF